MKKTIIFIILLAPLLTAVAQQEYYTLQENEFVYNGMWFRQTGDTTAEVRMDAFAGLPVQSPLVIPTAVQDSSGRSLTVTRIGSRALDNNTGRHISSITLPETLLEIGDRAFSGNDSLRSIAFPSRLRRIEDYAFTSIPLTSVTLPDSLEYFAPTAFFWARGITGFNIANCPRFCTVDGILYNSDTTVLITTPNVMTDTFYILQHVRRLGEASLTQCGASKIFLNEGLLEIGLKAIPYSYFDTIIIPASVAHIDGNPCYGTNVTGLTVIVDSANQHYKTVDKMLISYDGDTLLMCFGAWSGAKELSEGIRVIAHSAFTGIRWLDSIGLPQSLEEIGDYAFAGSSCYIISFPDNLRRIGTEIGGTRSKIVLPNSLVDIAEYAFAYRGIDTITFGDSIRVIPRGVLYNTPLKKVTLGSNVEHIMPEAFVASYGAGRLKINDDYMPASLRTIGRDAFRGYDIQRVKFRHNPDTVGEYAFDQTLRVFFEDTVPPVVYTNSFMPGCDVYVPCHGTDIFTAAPGWGPSFNYLESPCPTTSVGEADIEAAFSATAVGGRITVTRHQPTELAIYDIMGRRLLLCPAAAGTTVFDVPATGVYILRTNTPTGTASKKLAVIR